MKTVELQTLFDIKKGSSKIIIADAEKDPSGINLVSASKFCHGISCKIKKLDDVEPFKAGLVTVAINGNSMLYSFVQTEPFYTTNDVAILTPKHPFTRNELIYYCACLLANRHKFSYGRTPSRHLATLKVPDIYEIPKDVNDYSSERYDVVYDDDVNMDECYDTSKWQWFFLKDLFTFKRGKSVASDVCDGGIVRLYGSGESNNGYIGRVSGPAEFEGNVITVVNRGSNSNTACAVYRFVPFCATDVLTVASPKDFVLNEYIGNFLSLLISLERPKFNIGRTLNQDRLNKLKIKLPVTPAGQPDWQWMEDHMRWVASKTKIVRIELHNFTSPFLAQKQG